jgi:hypothetical protein
VRRELAWTALALSALTAVMTHPLLLDARRALPNDLGDPLLNSFILGWDADRVLHGFRGLWTAPFYFPLPDTLALSEHLLGIAIFTSPVVWATHNPILAHNLAFFASYVLAGLGMYLLAKRLWGRRDAACLAALAFAFAPHRVMHLPHLQILMSGWMPLSLWGLHGYFATGSRRALAVFAAAFALLGLSNGYFLYFFSVPVAVLVVARLAAAVRPGDDGVGRDATWRMLVELGAAALAILAAIAPAAAAYLRVRHAAGLHRSLDEMATYSAAWTDFLRIPTGLWLWSGTLRVGEGERMLFPGVTIVVLAMIALISLRRPAWNHPESRPAGWTWHVGIYAVILGAALWLAAGPGVPGPYGLLVRFMPGFDGLRVPARFIVIVALALCVLGSAGAAWLLGRLRPRAALIAATLLGAAIVVEGYGGPIDMVPFRSDQRTRADLNRWLRAAPAGGVLELPIVGPGLAPFTLGYQYNTLLHGHPVINGYTGYGYGLQDFLGGPGSPLRDPAALPDLLSGLRTIGVRYVLVHRSLYFDQPGLGWPDPTALVEAIEAAPGTTGPGRRYNDVIAWTLAGAPRRSPIDESRLARLPASAFGVEASNMPDRLQYALDGKLETKWLSGRPQDGGEWIRLTFARETDVARLVVLTPPGGVGDYPRGLDIESETGDGSRIPLYAGPFVAFLVRGLAGPLTGSPAVLDLPSNASRAVWIRQTGQSRTWQWAIHELQVYERRRP